MVYGLWFMVRPLFLAGGVELKEINFKNFESRLGLGEVKFDENELGVSFVDFHQRNYQF